MMWLRTDYHGLSGVLFESSVPVSTRLAQGCSPVGPRHYITESSNNIIIRIDEAIFLSVYLLPALILGIILLEI